jgi:hypothetical protein
MIPNRKVLEDRPYSFSEVFQLNIPAADLLPALGYGFTREFIDFPGIQPVDVSSLEQEFREVLPYTDLNNEQARRETIVSSIVKFLVRRLQCRLSYEYSIQSPRFYGNIDYFLQKQFQVVVIEAKRDDLENGFNQLAAELIALDCSDYADDSQTTLVGFLTTGTLWQIAALHRQTSNIVLSLNTYRVPEDLQTLVPILISSLQSPDNAAPPLPT